MYKLKTGRHFEKTASLIEEGCANSKAIAVSHAVMNFELCADSRLLLVAGASGHVTLFRFVKTESSQDIAVRKKCFFLF